MIKRIVLFCGIIILTFAVSYGIHKYYLTTNNIHLPYLLLGVYAYFAVFSIIVYVSVEGLISIIPHQVGYAYMAFIFLKIGIFVLLFKNTFFSEEILVMSQKLAVIIPFFLFLVIEGIGVTRMLNRM